MSRQKLRDKADAMLARNGSMKRICEWSRIGEAMDLAMSNAGDLLVLDIVGRQLRLFDIGFPKHVLTIESEDDE